MITDIKNYNFADIVFSIKNLLSKSMYDENIRQLAVEIKSKSDDPVSGIFDWVSDNILYVPDPNGIELFISPVRMIKDYNEGKQPGGDCDDIALLTVALLRSIGVKSHVSIVDVKGSGWDHAIAVAYSERLGKEIFVDPTSSKPLGWIDKYIKRYDVE